jgi:plastocyanin
VVLAVLIVSVAVLAGGCSDDGGDGGSAAEEPDLSEADFVDATASTEVDVQARDNSFVPPYVEVQVGTTVTFTNRGRTDHDVFPVTEGEFEPIEPAELEPGDAASITLDEPGDVPYYCTLHGTTTKGMVGAIRVVE